MAQGYGSMASFLFFSLLTFLGWWKLDPKSKAFGDQRLGIKRSRRGSSPGHGIFDGQESKSQAGFTTLEA